MIDSTKSTSCDMLATADVLADLALIEGTE
jgi:hypothetical protein